MPWANDEDSELGTVKREAAVSSLPSQVDSSRRATKREHAKARQRREEKRRNKGNIGKVGWI